MRLLVISLCTSGAMKDQFIWYCRQFALHNNLYCITNDNVSNDEVGAHSTLNLSYKRKKPWTYFSLRKLKRIKEFLKRINPDIVYIFTPHPVNIFIKLYVRNYRLIYQVHDPLPHSGTGFLDRVVLKIQHKIYFPIADVAVVAGQALKEQILSNYNTINENKIRVVKFGITDNILFPNLRYTIDQNIDILYFGRIEYYKGLDILMDALGQIDKAYRCVLIGKGSISKVYKGIKIPQNVEIINDYLSEESLAKKIAESRVLVFPYRDATGTSTIGQAFYYGKPVVATDVGVLKEYVGDGGIIICRENASQLAEALKSLLENNEKRMRLSQTAYHIYEKEFDIKQYAANMQIIFNDLMK